MSFLFWIQFAKVLHFVGLISWMAGLFYLPRLFIYHREALDMPEPNRSILATHLADYERRLYKIIMNPAMMITVMAGFSMVFLYGWDWFKANIWLHWKFIFIAGLVFFHLRCKRVMLQLANGEKVLTSTKLRLFNEIPTMLMLAIVLLAVTKGTLNMAYFLAILVGFGGFLVWGIRFYKKIRQAEQNNN